MEKIFNTLKNLNLSKKILLVLFILFILFLFYSLINRKNLLKLQQQKDVSMENYVNNEPLKFSLYHVKWCGHCKTTKPEFDKLVNDDRYKTINGKTIIYEKIDCEESPDRAEKAGVEGYPTIKLNDKIYEGERTVEGFLTFLKSNI
jgi:thiol-disulfide isomerase/thioredoxin